jgi:hypothetical protein
MENHKMPIDILKTAERVLDSVLCCDHDADGGTEGVRSAAINEIGMALVAERVKWFNELSALVAEIERLRKDNAYFVKATFHPKDK